MEEKEEKEEKTIETSQDLSETDFAQFQQSLRDSKEKIFFETSTKERKSFEWGDFYDFLVDLVEKKITNYEMIFPPSLNSQQRKNLHTIADRLGIQSKSEGKDRKRRIILNTGSLVETSGKKTLEHKKDQKFDKIPSGISEVLPGFLYLGSCRDAKDKTELLSRKVKYVLNCAKEWHNLHFGTFVYKDAKLMDVEDQPILTAFEDAFEFIEKARSENCGVFVHCIIGKSRSASVVLAYLMRHKSMSLKESYDYLKSRRPLIQPNDGFMAQLIQLEKGLYNQTTMKEGDWVPIHVPKHSKKKVEALPSPLPPAIIKDEIDQLCKQLEQTYLTKEILTGYVENICEGNYQNKSIAKFIHKGNDLLTRNKQLQEELLKSGIKFTDVGKQFKQTLKDFYLSGIENQK